MLEQSADMLTTKITHCDTSPWDHVMYLPAWLFSNSIRFLDTGSLEFPSDLPAKVQSSMHEAGLPNLNYKS